MASGATEHGVPSETASGLPRAGPGSDSEAFPKVKVLIVDDQPNNLLALEAVLAGVGLELVRAHSGEQALAKVLEDDYAAILMDVQMPGLDGFETAELIRERDRSRHTPILFLTAFQSTEAQITRGYTLGAVDFLAKPVVPAVLRAKVAVFVELFLKTEQVRRQAERLVETQRREYESWLADERRRWELDWLRGEAAREKQAAEVLARQAEELKRSITERTRAEEEVRHRAAQQAVVAELGQVALAGSDPDDLVRRAVAAVASGLDVEFGWVTEAAPDGGRPEPRAGYGWREGLPEDGAEAEGPGSLTAFTLACDDPVVITDLKTEARFEPPLLLRAHGVVSGLSVCVRGRARPFGALGVFSASAHDFSRDDVHFLRAVANLLAAAIERRRDEAELAAVKDELEVQLTDMMRLHSLSERLSNTLELPDVLEKVLSTVTGLQGTDRGVLMLYDRERDSMATAASVGFAPEQLEQFDAATAGSWPKGITAMIGGGIVVANAPPDPLFSPHLNAALGAGYQAVCSTPLLTCSGELVGTIATYFPRPHNPSDRETRLVELYARQAAEFIDNARLYRKIQEADRRKGEFLAMLGHELRNPLAPILNALHVMRLPGIGPEDVGRARDVAERQVRHLARLVDDLLDVSRISSGKIELRKGRVDLREAAECALETARPLLDARKHELSVSMSDQPLPLLADRARLEQVLANLLNNSAKYTEPGGRIALEVGRENGDAVVRVSDNGIGIDPELLPNVFEMFTQAERSLDRSQGGLGIGLTLVRRLVELHGGQVSAHSEGVGRGSEFVVRLPLAPHDCAEPSTGREPCLGADTRQPDRSAVRPRRVLVVDDNVDGAVILARLLKAGGFIVDVAHDGPMALEVAQSKAPEVVLLDIGLPEMDGYEVARRLRTLKGLEQVRLVALTGYGQETDRVRSSAAGFDYHLVKPVDPETVRELILEA